jgi:chromosome segregation protein
VLGTLLDYVEVDAGWETAFEAAAGEALAAVVVDSVDAGRRALAALRAGDVAGAVLPLGAASSAVVAVSAGEPLRRHVRSSRSDVEALLDALVGAAVVVDGGWEAAVEVALANPTAVVVTSDGNRFGTTGWRVGGTTSGATGAALDEARTRAEAAAATASGAEQAAVAARAEAAEARRAEAAAAKAVGDVNRRREVSGGGLARAERERGEAESEAESLAGQLDELAGRVERDGARVAELQARLPELEAEESEVLRQARAMADARAQLEERSRAVATLRNDIEVRAAGLEERRSMVRQRLAEVEERLSHNVAERQAAEIRRVELDTAQQAVDRLAAAVGERLARVEVELGQLRERRRRQSESARQVAADLDRLRKERAAAERALEELREHARRADLERTEVQLRLEAAVESLRRDLDCEPDQAKLTLCPPLPEGVSSQARVRDLDRELRLMGPVNPLALQEYEALQERHQLIQDQLDDVRTTRRELAKVIRAIDTEIVNVFAAAYADVAQNFEALFETLFPGGRGRLTLTDPENLLTTGIEVEAKPSGKNVRKLSLLSGGERSLTALAFLFAVFRSRPSPFYVMDEVEAALDDVNLHRFLDLLAEFRKEAQLIVVSHQKRTMEAADCLYGVTMQPGGSSRVVSERVTTLAS